MEPMTSEGYIYQYDERLNRKRGKTFTLRYSNLLIALLCIIVLVSLTMNVAISTKATAYFGWLKTFLDSKSNITHNHNCSDLH